jgi:hypothetical protein
MRKTVMFGAYDSINECSSPSISRVLNWSSVGRECDRSWTATHSSFFKRPTSIT